MITATGQAWKGRTWKADPTKEGLVRVGSGPSALGLSLEGDHFWAYGAADEPSYEGRRRQLPWWDRIWLWVKTKLRLPKR